MAENINNSVNMTSDDSIHKIYQNDPIYQRNLIDKVIEITRVDDKKITGTVYTVDPVSECFVLVNKNENNDGTNMDIIPGHSIKDLKILEDKTPHIYLTKFDLNAIDNEKNKLSSEEIKTLRNKLKDWLEKNLLKFQEDGDILFLGDAIKIIPPYTSEHCISENEIILDKIKQLIIKMPSD